MHTSAKPFVMVVCYILLKPSFASVIISAVRYIQENQMLQVLTLYLFYAFIVVNTYTFGLHFGVAAINYKNERM